MVGGIIFFIATLAELNRTPFDLAEAEQELVAGYLTEYSGMRWGIFMFAEYVNLVVISGIVSTLYFGGWRAPFEVLDFIPGPIWLFLKICVHGLHLHVGALDHLPLPLQPADVHRLEGAAASVHRQPGRHGHRHERWWADMGLIDVVKKAAFVDILRGMSVTGTYFVVDKVTVEYPKEKLQTYPRFRGIHALLTDPDTGDTKCVACMLCPTICPSQCIHVEGEETPDGRSHARPASTSTWRAASSAACARRSARWRPS